MCDFPEPFSIGDNQATEEEHQQNFFGWSRACMVCGLVKSSFLFLVEGCANCELLLLMRGDQRSVFAHTSDTFNNAFLIMVPENGWVTGLYALSVVGHIPQPTLTLLHSLGIGYRAVPPDNYSWQP